MITLGKKKVKVIKSKVLKNGSVGAYVRYPDKSVKWRIIGKSQKGGDYGLSGLVYRSEDEKLKALGINPKRYKLNAKNIKNLISNKVPDDQILNPDQKKSDFTKTQGDSFSNNELFSMQYFCELTRSADECRKFRSKVKAKYPPADYRSNSRDYDAKLLNIDPRKYKLNSKNIKNLISNKVKST
jgi:hypothetical protein